MKSTVFLLFVLCSLFTSATVQAATYEVTPLVGYTFGGHFEDPDTENKLDLGEGESFGLILSMRDTKGKPGGFYEILYSRQATHIEGDGTAFSGDSRLDLDIHYLHLGGRYGTEGETFNPFVVAGVGVTYLDPEQGDSETKFSFSIGAGVNIPLNERFGLRFEGRGFGTILDNDSTLFCHNNQCAVQVKGDALWQYSGFAGVTFTF